MKFRQLIVSSIISVCALSAQAAFVAGMSPAQIRVEVAAQQAAGGDVTTVVANAVAAGINLNSLVAVLVTMPGISATAAVSAVVRAAPAQAAAIAAAAASAAPAQAAAIASAAATAAPQAAAAIASSVATAVPAAASAIAAAVVAAVPAAAAAVNAAVQQAAAQPLTVPPTPIATPTTQTLCSVSCS